ncbi:MAG TPA: DUF305 domain-containing protein [Vicinamibacterales bacterium]
MAAPLPGLVRRPAVLAVGLLAVTVCVAAGVLIGSWRATPRDDSAEAGFARDMATHHAQAVDMSFVVRDKSTDRDIRALASDIIVTQSTQRGMFMGWLQQWGLPQASARPRMAWMPGHVHSTPATDGPVLMHGMATEAELRSLEEANGVDAEVRFLQLMIRHHEGGIIMARALMALSERRELVQMAKSIDEGQRAEIALMRNMVAARGAQPLPSILE